MRKAYELAYCTAKIYSRASDVDLECIDTINFLKPVNVGDLLKFESIVIYSKPKLGLIRVKVIVKGQILFFIVFPSTT